MILNNDSQGKLKHFHFRTFLTVQRIAIYLLILIILPLKASFSYLDSTIIYTSCPDKFISVSTDFNQFLSGTVSNVRIEIETHKRFGSEVRKLIKGSPTTRKKSMGHGV
jgi:hypothetical protein